MKVFSITPVTGTINTNQEKYNAVAICPISTKGELGCWLPIHIKMKKSATNTQKKNFINGLNWLPLILDVSTIGIINKINNEANIAITPNNLLGIDLNIA
jgi:hypothetical protein